MKRNTPQAALDALNDAADDLVDSLQSKRKGVLRTAFSGALAIRRLEKHTRALGAALEIPVEKSVTFGTMAKLTAQAAAQGLDGAAKLKDFTIWLIELTPQFKAAATQSLSPFHAIRTIKATAQEHPLRR